MDQWSERNCSVYGILMSTKSSEEFWILMCTEYWVIRNHGNTELNSLLNTEVYWWWGEEIHSVQYFIMYWILNKNHRIFESYDVMELFRHSNREGLNVWQNFQFSNGSNFRKPPKMWLCYISTLSSYILYMYVLYVYMYTHFHKHTPRKWFGLQPCYCSHQENRASEPDFWQRSPKIKIINWPQLLCLSAPLPVSPWKHKDIFFCWQSSNCVLFLEPSFGMTLSDGSQTLTCFNPPVLSGVMSVQLYSKTSYSDLLCGSLSCFVISRKMASIWNGEDFRYYWGIRIAV